jgi:hypothetical protein
MLNKLSRGFSVASICASLLFNAPAAMATNSAVEIPIGAPGAITVDALGNLFFSSPNLVLKLDTHGIITRVAGNVEAGYSGDGGPAIQALLNFPKSYPELVADPLDFGEFLGGLAVDASGSLYIADAYNNRVRKVDPQGVITTIVDPSSMAETWPQGVATDAAGNLYISYTGTYGALLKRTPNGLMSTLAVPGCLPGPYPPCFPADIFPAGIAVDAGGNLYIADGYSRVRKVGPDGSIMTIAGDPGGGGVAFTCASFGDSGPATSAALDALGVAVDGNGNVYVADTYNNCIRKIDVTGTITTVAGTGLPGYSGDGGPARNAQLNLPHGVAVDTAGNIYIADTANNRIRKVSSDGIIATVAGSGDPSPYPTQGAAQFDIGPGITGSWYDPAQSGHGLLIEVLPDNRFYAAWFAFNPAGTQQAWFTGVGSYSGNTATITSVEQPAGGRWIPNFDPSQIVRNAWGTLTFTFTDCNHGTVNFNSMIGYGTGSMNLTRLTLPAGLSCP